MSIGKSKISSINFKDKQINTLLKCFLLKISSINYMAVVRLSVSLR